MTGEMAAAIRRPQASSLQKATWQQQHIQMHTAAQLFKASQMHLQQPERPPMTSCARSLAGLSCCGDGRSATSAWRRWLRSALYGERRWLSSVHNAVMLIDLLHQREEIKHLLNKLASLCLLNALLLPLLAAPARGQHLWQQAGGE